MFAEISMMIINYATGEKYIPFVIGVFPNERITRWEKMDEANENE